MCTGLGTYLSRSLALRNWGQNPGKLVTSSQVLMAAGLWVRAPVSHAVWTVFLVCLYGHSLGLLVSLTLALQ